MSYFDDVIEPRILNGTYYTGRTKNKMTYDNTNRGALFRNNKKTEKTHADFNGTINIEGKEYWLNMWDNAGNGPAYRLTVKPKEMREPVQKFDAQAPSTLLEDDSPF